MPELAQVDRERLAGNIVKMQSDGIDDSSIQAYVNEFKKRNIKAAPPAKPPSTDVFNWFKGSQELPTKPVRAKTAPTAPPHSDNPLIQAANTPITFQKGKPFTMPAQAGLPPPDPKHPWDAKRTAQEAADAKKVADMRARAIQALEDSKGRPPKGSREEEIAIEKWMALQHEKRPGMSDELNQQLAKQGYDVPQIDIRHKAKSQMEEILYPKGVGAKLQENLHGVSDVLGETAASLVNEGLDVATFGISTVSIDPTNGLLYIADFSGFLYCLDAETGKKQWQYDMKAHMWGSTFVADGKVYLGDEDGDMCVFASDKKLKLLSEVNMGGPVYSTPIVANVVWIQGERAFAI